MLPDKARQFFAGLEAAGVDWVLVGAAAVNHYLKRPRATLDVDVVVREKDLRKAKRVLKAACPDLRETESSPLGPPEGTVVNFHGTLSPDPMRLEADVIKSQSHELFGVALDRKVVAGGVKVATVEVLLALKYLAAVSPWRRPGDKHQDVADFIKAFKDNRDRIDRALLLDLAFRADEGAREDFPRFLDSV
ncbi:MAG: nucleotidyl transferase AbiEii/AbiGii toxin family protein, partial [Planctomycetes bacterium]|nr:nucleotidyl transferase AbiEii/AbiGii toxin family protein [Planctomycetota bacterium]